MSPLKLCTFALVAFAMSANAPAQIYRLVGNSAHQDGGTSVIYDLDYMTGAATNGRDTGIEFLNGIKHSTTNDNLYGLTNFASTPFNSLIQINESNGTHSVVGNVGLSFAEGDLAFDALGDIWGINQLTGGTSTTQRGLVKIDAGTGAGTLIANLAYADWSALAFDNSDRLFAITSNVTTTNNNMVFELDKDTGAVLSSAVLDITIGQTSGLVFHPGTNVAYFADGEAAGTNNLYTLDVATGTTTLIGATGVADGFAGLSFLTIPEPSSAVLLLVGTTMAIVRRRR